ncbi:MAG: hypothetical protein ACODAU_06785 [Myxococcota bacterium]
MGEPGDVLREAREALEVGDHRRVRALCRPLVRAEDAEVRAEATALLRRVAVDPAQLAVLAACLAFFAAIVYVYALT